MRLMDTALTKTSLPDEAEQVLREFFNDTSTFMINR